MEKKKREFIDLLKSFHDYYGTYHHHKEVMTWVTTVLFLGKCSPMLLKTGIIENINKNLLNFLFVSIFFTFVFSFFFQLLYWQFRKREFANNMVIACTNLISRIFDNERIKLDMKKRNFNGIY